MKKKNKILTQHDKTNIMYFDKNSAQFVNDDDEQKKFRHNWKSLKWHTYNMSTDHITIIQLKSNVDLIDHSSLGLGR